MKTIAIFNRKGGTGKTTIALALATALAQDRHVLLVDLDSQANATQGLNAEPFPAVAAWLIMEQAPELVHIGSPGSGLYLMPGNAKTERANITLSSDADFSAIHRGLRHNLAGWHFDLVLLDCPPSLSMLTKAAIYAADYVLCPTICEYWSLTGVRELSLLIQQIRERFDRPTQLLGIQPNKYDRRTNEHKIHLVNLARVYGAYGAPDSKGRPGRVWPPLRQSIVVATAAAEGRPLWDLLTGHLRQEWTALVERVACDV
jgi:chromosome partitioning protein